MTADEIKGNLIIRGKTMTMIALRAGVSRPCITRVVQRRSKSERVQRIIAQELGIGFEEVWKAVA